MPTLEQIQGKVKRLQAQAEALIAKQAKTVLADIRKLMDEYGLTTADIEAHSATKKRAGRPAGGAAAKVGKGKAATRSTALVSAKGKLPPKYRDPKTGATWSGHARPPAWIAKVGDRTKFLIDGAGGAASANGVSGAKVAPRKTAGTTGTVAHMGQRNGPLPAKYRDPKSGATWSGRGPAPAWLATAKDRTKFLIDGVAVAPASGAVAKKGTARKVGAAKSETTAKTPSVKKAAKKTPVSSAKSVAGKKAAKPAVKKVAKSNVVSRKAAVTKKAVTPSHAMVAPATAPEAANSLAMV